MQKSFIEVLKELEFGELGQDLTHEQAVVIEAVRSTEKSGIISIKLVYSYANGVVDIEASIDKKVPKPDRGATAFTLTPEGNLEPIKRTQESLDFGDEGRRHN